MKLAIAYSTKDQTELTVGTLPLIENCSGDIYWCDGSRTEEGIRLPKLAGYMPSRVFGGADAAIAWKLSTLLASPQGYTHIMLLENDVLLDPDWYEPTISLFEKGKQDGLHVGAVSPRSYVDRVLLQRDGFAVMHNIGAGVIIFTREAAQIVLSTLRTHWWPDNVRLFGQLSGIDLRTYACFRGNEQHITTDWGWEAQLARHGLASLALTPAKCEMVGQNPPLAQQGLELTNGLVEARRDDKAFLDYAIALDRIRVGYAAPEYPSMIHRDSTGQLFFSHQLGALNAEWRGKLELQWSQGFGPFAYRAGPGGVSLSVRISGACSILADGGRDGARVIVEDTRSGFRAQPVIEAGSPMIQIPVSGGPIPRQIQVHIEEGGVFYGLQTADPQMIDTTFKFDWSQLPEAK